VHGAGAADSCLYEHPAIAFTLPPAQEFAAGHVRGALNLEVSKFEDNELLDGLIKEVAQARCNARPGPGPRLQQAACCGLCCGRAVLRRATRPTPAQPAHTSRPAPTRSTVVVHCQLSLKRGPAAAALLAKRLQEQAASGAAGPQPQVLVLRGGFQQFGEQFKDDPQLVEGSGPADGHH
jgi:rhodanese-related sulfurtransferase